MKLHPQWGGLIADIHTLFAIEEVVGVLLLPLSLPTTAVNTPIQSRLREDVYNCFTTCWGITTIESGKGLVAAKVGGKETRREGRVEVGGRASPFAIFARI